MSTLPLAVGLPLAALCATIIITDLRLMRIPDWISVAAAALFVLWAILGAGDFAVLPRLLVAGVTFGICFGLFAARLMGGGDTKVIPALALFAAPEQLSGLLLLFSAALFVSIALILAARRWFVVPAGKWVGLQSQKLPMGVAIGATGIIAIGLALSHS